MKKFIFISLCIVLVLIALSGCSQSPAKNIVSQGNTTQSDIETEILLPFDESIELYFASGAGAWGSVVALNNDGAFEGKYHDSEGATVYVSNFNGKFGNFKKLDGNTYSMILENISTEKPIGEEWEAEAETEDEDEESITLRFIAAEPLGLVSDSGEFIFYTPDTPVNGLDKKFLSWLPSIFQEEEYGGDPNRLSAYGIWNKETGQGFFGREISE